MNQDVAIEVQHISKSFKISYDKSKTLKDKIIFAKKDKYEIHQVLDDVSFTIEKGEAVGLIGHNGCGKSTTLKLLTRIIYPDSGEISIDGRKMENPATVENVEKADSADMREEKINDYFKS